MTDESQPAALPALDPRLVREVGRTADGRRITYYGWRDGAGEASGPADD